MPKTLIVAARFVVLAPARPETELPSSLAELAHRLRREMRHGRPPSLLPLVTMDMLAYFREAPESN